MGQEIGGKKGDGSIEMLLKDIKGVLFSKSKKEASIVRAPQVRDFLQGKYQKVDQQAHDLETASQEKKKFSGLLTVAHKLK